MPTLSSIASWLDEAKCQTYSISRTRSEGGHIVLHDPGALDLLLAVGPVTAGEWRMSRYSGRPVRSVRVQHPSGWVLETLEDAPANYILETVLRPGGV